MKSTVLATAIAIATAVSAAPTASASPSGDIWNLANAQHTAAGCSGYHDNGVLGNTALSIAKTMLNPPGGIAGNGRVPADLMLSNAGYFVSSWGEADYQSGGAPNPQAAMDFWMANATRDIFPNCNNVDMATAVWSEHGSWAAVLLAAAPGGNPGTAGPP